MQRAQTSKVRSSLVAKLGEMPSFGKFSERISPIVLKDTLESVCQENAKRAHENLIEKPREKLFGGEHHRKAQKSIQPEPAKLACIRGAFTGYAGNYISFSDIERGKIAEGIPTSPNCESKFTVILPAAPEHSDFMPVLKTAFLESRQLGADWWKPTPAPMRLP